MPSSFAGEGSLPGNAGAVPLLREPSTRPSATSPDESYRAIFEHASDGIWVHDLTGVVLDVNAAAGAMFGYSREEMLTVGHEALIYPGSPYTPERVAEYMSRATAGERPRFEWLGRHRNGGEVWAEITMRRLTIGGEERIIAIARDIGERKSAERAQYICSLPEVPDLPGARCALLRRGQRHRRQRRPERPRSSQDSEASRF